MSKYMRDMEVASRYGISVAFVRRWRLMRDQRREVGPPFLRFGHAVRYREDLVENWANQQIVGSTQRPSNTNK